MMRFVIDETSWCFDGLAPKACVEALEILLDRLSEAQEQGHGACYSDELFNKPIWQEKTFYDLYGPCSPVPIPLEVQERVASLFDKLPKWQEIPSQNPLDFDVQIDKGGLEFAPSIAWAYAQTIHDSAHAVACIVFDGVRPAGAFQVSIASQAVTRWFVMNNQSCCEFFRWLIKETTHNSAEMEVFRISAFPNIDFVEGAFGGIKDMSKPYRELLEPLICHLAAFSDHGQRIFSGPWDRVPAEFGALGVDISDENGNTKRNSEARRERTIKICGEEIIFWWHSKLSPYRDRIHLYPDKIPKGGQLLVGIFCRHLTT
jgi:hypothetical protein